MRSRTTKIPVIRNKGVVVRDDRKPKGRWLLALVLAFGLALMLVYLKVQINTLMTDIERLENEYSRSVTENDKLSSEVVRLSSFGRIQKIARQLGLVFIPYEDIIELSQQNHQNAPR